MGPIQLVVFDMAGTTIDDTGNRVLSCLIETARIYDLPGTPDELNALMGMNKREVFELLVARRFPTQSSEKQPLAGEALATFIRLMKAAYAQHVTSIPGAEETFAFLKERGIKVALDTGFEAEVGGIILDRLNWLGRLVDAVIFSSDVSRGRPAPYMIFHAMEQLDIQDVRLVMKVGDSPADMNEGSNAGCGEVIGVLSGAHTAITLGRSRHTRIIQSVVELPGLFS